MKSIVGTIDRVAFSFGPFTLYWYGLIIAGAMLLAITLASKEGKKRGLGEEGPPSPSSSPTRSGIHAFCLRLGWIPACAGMTTKLRHPRLDRGSMPCAFASHGYPHARV